MDAAPTPPNPKVRDRDELRLAIKAAGKSYTDVGRAVGCTKSWIYLLVSGKRDSLATEKAEAIAEFLGVDKRDLFVFWEEQRPQELVS